MECARVLHAFFSTISADLTSLNRPRKSINQHTFSPIIWFDLVVYSISSGAELPRGA